MVFAFGRQQSCPPKTLKTLFDQLRSTHPPNFIENASNDTFDDQ
jgi:hypothetical protein